ncbi:hypothetical protein ALC60_03577 [Trachymyrmex zeteki]|uniref:Uncharacterized protein n=1 Tax=Mycetomoellerius zeteki TaxID=64791 RepID=A0A151XB66_9HYME|nr:hypothetical protein ALC60_03577 [Trachymyrmex zeteki]
MGCLVRITERRQPWGWLRDRMRNDEDEDRSTGMNKNDDEDGAGKFVRREGDIKGEDEGYQSPEKPRTQPPPTV